jgi:hypothetical protein
VRDRERDFSMAPNPSILPEKLIPWKLVVAFQGEPMVMPARYSSIARIFGRSVTNFHPSIEAAVSILRRVYPEALAKTS